MSEQHTPEPWMAHGQITVDGVKHVGVGIGGSLKVVALTGYSGRADENESIANARRIVAAVNACAGIPTDDLEQCPSGGLFHLANHANELAKQRDELLAALNAIEPFIPKTSANEGGAAAYSANVRAADLVRSAIASVKANT